ncbi:hypothetical protein ABZ383_27395 [Streptomyces sp. NPDC005900]|uniref:hypothetical protein n=1 Tax=Streptomyces sp. NPDC005900 TaxID=3154569 RepID=UPI0033F2C4F7
MTTTLTTAPALTTGLDPAYYAGRADAYDDEHTDGITTDVLYTRAEYLADHHPDHWYVIGYAARVLEHRHEHHTAAAAQTDLAYTDRKEHR